MAGMKRKLLLTLLPLFLLSCSKVEAQSTEYYSSDDFIYRLGEERVYAYQGEEEAKAAADRINQHIVEPIIKEKAAYDFNNPIFASLEFSFTRSGHTTIYVGEGSYVEGYSGDYSYAYADFYLWDDGLYCAKIRNTVVKGYWYNSSIEGGTSTGIGDYVDCLELVSNIDKYQKIVVDREKNSKVYSCAYVYVNMGWGNRAILTAFHRSLQEAGFVVSVPSYEFEGKNWLDLISGYGKCVYYADHIKSNFRADYEKEVSYFYNGEPLTNELELEKGMHNFVVKWRGHSVTINIRVVTNKVM